MQLVAQIGQQVKAFKVVYCLFRGDDESGAEAWLTTSAGITASML